MVTLCPLGFVGVANITYHYPYTETLNRQSGFGQTNLPLTIFLKILPVEIVTEAKQSDRKRINLILAALVRKKEGHG